MSEDGGVRGGRRRRANHDGGRSRVIQVRVSEAEDRLLRLAASNNGMSVQRWMIECVLRGDSGEELTARRDATRELQRAVRAVAAVGVNINQMAKAANASGELPEDVAATLSGLRGLLRRVDGAVDQVLAS